MLRKHHLEEIGAEPARRERRENDVGVERDPHEWSRNTSSSVR